MPVVPNSRPSAAPQSPIQPCALRSQRIALMRRAGLGSDAAATVALADIEMRTQNLVTMLEYGAHEPGGQTARATWLETQSVDQQHFRRLAWMRDDAPFMPPASIRSTAQSPSPALELRAAHVSLHR